MSTLPFHMRMAALQCNFEGGARQTLKVPKLWKSFGFNVEQLLHTHGELYTAVFEKGKYGEMLAAYLRETEKAGISIILYMNCHILQESLKDKIGEWAMVNKAGKYYLNYETYYTPCYNSGWRKYFLDSLEGLKGFDLSGVFFDGPTVHVCYCPHCKEKFRKLHAADLEEAPVSQAESFHHACRIDFIQKIYQKVKEINPAWLSYINAGLLHGQNSAEGMKEILRCNDIIGTEGGFQFYGPPREIDIWRCGLHAKMVEAVAAQKRKVIFMAGDHKSWSWYLHTPVETRLCYLSALANGCSIWYGIHSATFLLKGATGKTVKELVGFDRKNERLYERTESLADVALYFSLGTRHLYRSQSEETDFYGKGAEKKGGIGNYGESYQGAYGMLFRSGIHFDFVTELSLESLCRYRVLVVPSGACMSEKSGQVLRDFVTRGGVLIADSETSLYTEAFEKRPDFLLQDVFGASFAGTRKYNNWDYFAFADKKNPFGREGIPYLPAPLAAVEISVLPGTEVLANLCPPLAGRYSGSPEKAAFPFILKNRFGKGTCYYVAGTFFELYRRFGIAHHRRWVQSLISRHSRPILELLDAPECVEFTVRKAQATGTVLVHLVNYTGGMNRPIEQVVPVIGAKLKFNLPFRKARALRSGKKLFIKGKKLALPEIREFEVIELIP